MFNNQHTNAPGSRWVRGRQRELIHNRHMNDEMAKAEAKRLRKNAKRLRDWKNEQLVQQEK